MNEAVQNDSADQMEKQPLSELESKRILANHGAPVVRETVARTADEAVDAAEKEGWPVVLKGFGAALTHKTERNLVHLNLKDAPSVRRAAHLIEASGGDDLEGFLIQPLVEGSREFAAGMFRDEIFGPVVMFGVGGIMTEVFADASFRLAPLTETDAADMLDEIRSRALLDDFRGERSADRNALIQTLMGLSRIGLECPDIAEADINPLKVAPDGKVRAVDGLVITQKTAPIETFPPPVRPDAIGSLFFPKSIAFIGASAEMGKWGNMLLVNTISGGFGGEIHPVNPKGGVIANRRVFRTVEEIPGQVDLAVVTIPAALVIDLIPSLEKKGVKNMVLISSGFGETGEAGKKLEQRLIKEATEAGVLVLGPNTMGICNPHILLNCTSLSVHPRPGSTAIVAQSGNMGVQLLAFAETQGIGVRAFSGSGNEAMMTIEDYLDGLEADELTRTVMLYVESVKNGPRFFQSARRLGKKKPIVLLKGGRTTAGNKAAASHTGAMASDSRVFDAMCAQAGIVKVEHPMDLLDLAGAFSSLPLPKGNRAAIMTLGGGWGVVTADLCSEYALEIPELSPEILARVDTLLPPYWSRANPIDLVGETDLSLFITVLEELMKWDGCDAVINLGIIGRSMYINRLVDSVLKAGSDYSPEFLQSLKESMAQFEVDYTDHVARMMETYNKPVFGVSLLTAENEGSSYRHDNRRFKSVFYQTPERAVKAFARMFSYSRFLAR